MAHRILIVDDEEAIVFATQRYFTRRGFDVDIARGLAEAQSLVANARYALVIADLRLTGIHATEGLQIIDAIRSNSPGTRTLLLTAYGSPALEAEARRRGVDAVLRKPIPLPDLAQAVLALVEGQ